MSPPRVPLKDRLLARRKITPSGCWLYTGVIDRYGYGCIGEGRRSQLKAHRASYVAFVGEIPPGKWVLHKCDIPSCINPAHLFIGTAKDNTADMIKKGRRPVLKGENHPMSVLSDAEVRSIKRLRAKGLTLTNIADRFGISFQHVSAISRGVFRA